jgi:hypothetical protein
MLANDTNSLEGRRETTVRVGSASDKDGSLEARFPGDVVSRVLDHDFSVGR